MREQQTSTFFKNLKNYFTRKNLGIALLGFSSGLPIMMTLSTLTYWLSQYGIDKATIGMASLLGLPYAFKFLWAPLLDNLNLPFLLKLGRRKGWIIFFQFGLMSIFIGLSLINPKGFPVITGVLIFLLAFLSASQDIVIDAFRIDYLTVKEQSYGSSSSLMMYRIGMLFTGAGVLSLSDIMSWSHIFRIVAFLFAAVLILTLFIQEPHNDTKREEANLSIEQQFSSLFRNILLTFRQFFQREQALLLIIFIICFKLPDAISGVMIPVFYKEMGYSGTEIGAVTKIYGLIATLVGAFMAGSIIHSIGLYRSLFLSTILIGITNLAYLLILSSPTIFSLMAAISVENFISGFASALFIMFLSLLCDKEFSATQYALLSSLSAVGLRLFGGYSGFLVANLGWGSFFITTAFLFVPALILLLGIRKRVKALAIK